MRRTVRPFGVFFITFGCQEKNPFPLEPQYVYIRLTRCPISPQRCQTHMPPRARQALDIHSF